MSTETIVCGCGCGTAFRPSRCTAWRLKTGRIAVAYISGHSSRGERNCRWNGGKSTSAHGYVLIRKLGHPNADVRGYVLEHRLVMSEHLGRPLTPNEVVHHKNGLITDNRIENLELHTAATHRALHDPNISRRVIKTKTCARCSRVFVATYGNHKRAKLCSIRCRNTAGDSALRRKVSIADEEVIRRDVNTPTIELARRYGVSLTTIKRIRRGRPQ